MAVRGELIENKYEVLKEIGRGGMSIVYLAMDKHLNKQWAIKEIKKLDDNKKNQIDVKALKTEANLMKKLDYPSLPRIVDIVEDEDKVYVIMDYVEGESLDKILKREGAQPQEQVIEWAKQLCGALNYLHKQTPPVIYRDMKPANIMLRPEGNLKLIDFGIAREYKEQNISDTINLGTRGYAAPEQFGTGQTDARTDIYCLGATLYHLVTGKNPAEEPYVMYPIRTWNPMLSSGLEYIITKCTKSNPDDRYRNCDELMYALEHYNEVDDQFKHKEKRKIWIFSVMAAISLVLLILGIAFNVAKINVNDKDYEHKISISVSTEYNEKIKNYKEAIKLYPYKIEAYIKLLEAYADNNKFTDVESSEFMNLYNAAFNDANKGKYDEKSIDFAELNYELGITYLYLFSEADDSDDSLKSKALRALPFFQSIVDNVENPDTFANYKLAESYEILCSFYKNYVTNSKNTKEPTYEIYSKLLESLDACVDNLQLYEYDDIAYIKLTVYEALLDLIQTQRKGLASTRVEQNRIISLMDKIYSKCEDIAVTQDKSVQKQQNILSKKAEYYNNIKNVYINTEERQ